MPETTPQTALPAAKTLSAQHAVDSAAFVFQGQDDR